MNQFLEEFLQKKFGLHQIYKKLVKQIYLSLDQYKE